MGDAAIKTAAAAVSRAQTATEQRNTPAEKNLRDMTGAATERDKVLPRGQARGIVGGEGSKPAEKTEEEKSVVEKIFESPADGLFQGLGNFISRAWTSTKAAATSAVKYLGGVGTEGAIQSGLVSGLLGGGVAMGVGKLLPFVGSFMAAGLAQKLIVFGVGAALAVYGFRKLGGLIDEEQTEVKKKQGGATPGITTV